MNPLESIISAELEDALETSFQPIPVGNYNAEVHMSEDNPKISSGTSDRGPWYRLDVKFDITDLNLKSQMGKDRISVTQSIFLDVDAGKIVRGPDKNIELGRLMKACGLNAKGASIQALRGKPLNIRVIQQEDKKDPGVIRNKVVAYSEVN